MNALMYITTISATFNYYKMSNYLWNQKKCRGFVKEIGIHLLGRMNASTKFFTANFFLTLESEILTAESM